MSMRMLSLTLMLIVTFGVIPAQAQYKEISKVDSLAKDMTEQSVFGALSTHFGVPVESLKQEKSTNDLSFGQLYMVHALAKASGSDVKSILADSKTKYWPEIAKEKKIDMKQLSEDESELEKSIKKLQSAK